MEARKVGAFDDVHVTADSLQNDRYVEDATQSQQQQQAQTVDDSASSKEYAEQMRALREEQARLDLIVTAAARNMVAVRSTRGVLDTTIKDLRLLWHSIWSKQHNFQID